MVGPLPFLQPARERTPAAESVPAPPVLHQELPAAVESIVAAPVVETPVAETAVVEVPIEETPVVETSVAETAVVEIPVEETPVVETSVAAETELAESFAPAAEIEPLVLSGADDFPASAMTRTPWTIEERAEPVETSDGGLFGEDLSLTQGGAPVMRHGDIEFQAPASFDWSETGAFIVMGAVGLAAFGAAMAAFRLASEQSGGDETTIIAWVLAVIGATCVGVSSFNLYRRWGLPGGDN